MDKPSEAATPTPKKDAPAKGPAKIDEKKPIDDVVREHVQKHLESSADQAKREAARKEGEEPKAIEGPPLLAEHAEKLPPWQRRAVLARFHAHGLRHDTRIHEDAFKAVLDDTLKGRI